jgi:hypothetical protein
VQQAAHFLGGIGEHAGVVGRAAGQRLGVLQRAFEARAMSDRAWKPTVAELPASECAQATVESGTRWFISSAHSLISVASRRDHSSASFR